MENMENKIIKVNTETVHSSTLNKDLTLEVFSLMGREGKELKILTHKSLETAVIENAIGYEFKCISSETAHSVVECRMEIPGRIDSSNKPYTITGIGESMFKSLNSSFAKGIPTYMAYKRAFDDAAVIALGIPSEKYFTEVEMAEDKAETVPETHEEYTSEAESAKAAVNNLLNETEEISSPISPVENGKEGIVKKENTDNVDNKKDDKNGSENNTVSNEEKPKTPEKSNENVNSTVNSVKENNSTSNPEEDNIMINFGPAKGMTVGKFLNEASEDTKNKIIKLFKFIDKISSEEERNIMYILKRRMGM